jgi:hypothetical protein
MEKINHREKQNGEFFFWQGIPRINQSVPGRNVILVIVNFILYQQEKIDCILLRSIHL